MNNQFDDTIIQELIEAIQYLSRNAKRKKFSTWKKTVEICSDLIDYVRDNKWLSDKQLEIIKRGYEQSMTKTPDCVLRALNGDWEAEEVDELEALNQFFDVGEEEPKISLTKAELELILTSVAKQAADIAFELQKAK